MTLEKHKERVLWDLSHDGSCRVAVASTSLGMGVDIPDLRCVIFYGCPKRLEDFIQGIGRAGRDKESSSAILLYRAAGRESVKGDENFSEKQI